ncbi:LamG domain-containing protein [bacterium SCSIO 12696]|nr:LamG domain-containing protein [bacterium SCSIO 12696]
MATISSECGRKWLCTVRGSKTVTNLQITRLLKATVLPAAVLLLTACSGGSGSPTTALPNPNPGGGGNVGGVVYNGPAPQTADVQSFRIHVWDNLVEDNRCGQCHGDSLQSPAFVRTDDINTAYNAANAVVDLNNPANSVLVTQVAGGHNCWLASDQACADIIQGYIEDWANDSVGGSGSVISLTAPAIRDVGDSKTFPADSADFGSTVYPLLTQYCSNCHSDDAGTPQQPYFAAADVDVAYAAVQSRIDLDDPARSRLVVRLRNEFHNCWDDCSSNATEMENAITAFADGIPLTTVDPQLVISKALTLFDGVLANTGGRHESNAIAKYEFKTGSGFTAFDTSGVDPAMDLTISGNVEWVGGFGIRINDGKAQATTAASAKLHNLIAGSSGTGEYSIEAWVAPGNVTQDGPAGIVSYSGGNNIRNFTLGQTLYNYDFLNRSSTTDGNGEPALSTADADERLQATLQHVVVNYDPVNGRRIYVNGEYTGDLDSVGGGNLSDWDDTFAFVLGNEVSNQRLWQGVFRLVAIHNRVLTDEQIQDNFDAGVGAKYLLLFSVSDLVSVPDAYIVVEVSQFDSYSYLFNAPYFISLDSTATPDNIPVQGMRIGINGREAPVGQAYQNLDITLNANDYSASGQVMSDRGTIVALEKGPESDEFFLTFERIGSNTNVVLEPVPPTPATPADLDPQSDIGLRTFDEINATMAAATGVSATQTDVQNTFNTVRQQLPTVESINGFLSAHQMGVTQLAIEYCNALVEDTSLRTSYFNSFNFAASAATAFDTQGERDLIITPLLNNIVGTNLSSQPDDAAMRTELNNLIGTMTANPATDTSTVVKATCAAVLASATMLIQ